MIPQDEKRITLPDDVYLALEEYAAESRKKLPKDLQPIMTAKSAAQSILRGKLVTDGYLMKVKRGE